MQFLDSQNGKPPVRFFFDQFRFKILLSPFILWIGQAGVDFFCLFGKNALYDPIYIISWFIIK